MYIIGGSVKLLEMKKTPRLFIGLVLCAIGVVLTINANLGLAPWDVLHEGLANKLNITIGQSTMLVSAIVIALDVILGEKIGIATILNIVVVGWLLDIIMLNNLIPVASGLLSGIIMLTLGMFALGLGCAMYLSVGMGSGPRDGLMIALQKRTNKSTQSIRSTIEIGALIVGFFLGGSVGIGTIITGFGLGYSMQIVFEKLDFRAVEIKHRYISDEIKDFKNRKLVKDEELANIEISVD